jgi:rubrerythrin
MKGDEMPEFVNPFSGVTPDRKMTAREVTRGIRLSLAAEEEAVHLYEALADSTDNPLAKAVLQDIADEERVHAGEFQRLLNILLPDEEKMLADGAEEVDEMAEAIKKGEQPGESEDAESEESEPPTIGDLKD